MPIIDRPRPAPIELVCSNEKKTRNAFAESKGDVFTQEVSLSLVTMRELIKYKSSFIQSEKFAPVTKSLEIQLAQLRRKRGFNITYIRLNELYRDVGEYNDDFLRPTRYAFNTAMDFLVKGGVRLRGPFPKAWASADGEGGLSLEWRNDGRKITLFIPAKPESKIRILYKSDSERGVVAASPLVLAKWLSWLTKTEFVHV